MFVGRSIMANGRGAMHEKRKREGVFTRSMFVWCSVWLCWRLCCSNYSTTFLAFSSITDADGSHVVRAISGARPYVCLAVCRFVFPRGISKTDAAVGLPNLT